MESTTGLDYAHGYEYAIAWAQYDRDDLTRFSADGKRFFGTLGSLEFQYSPESHSLQVWSFIAGGADPSTERSRTIKARLDVIAQRDPAQTSQGTFDIRTLAWNKQATAKLEPCLWLRLDIHNSSLSPEEMTARLNDFSRTGYIWHRQKIQEVLATYWREHPKVPK